MEPERWKKLEELFQAASELPAGARESFLGENCGEDAALADEVRKLLSSADDSDDFIERSVWTDGRFLDTEAVNGFSDSFDESELEDPDVGLVGKKIGAFRLNKEIGRGGMGAVYLAERADGEFTQRVAVKLIKRGMDSDFIISRFRHERQILASFEHPNIARLLDGGTTKDGIPFFVMEYIDGKTLHEFCDANRHTVAERLELFVKVCSAVSYAHEHQIVHRDIKPGNVLIDRHGAPKLLDFGIAKILDPELIHESVNPTASMLRMLTPDYASPEQLQSGEITPASDLYSLGVLLYELVSGHRPFQIKKKTIAEVTRTVCEEIPAAPSVTVSDPERMLSVYENDVGRLADARNTDVENLKEQLAGPLDNIVMKCLAKDPSERYASVNDLVEDIRRHLTGRAVYAPPYSVWSRAASDPLQRISEKSTRLAVLPLAFIDLAPVPASEETYLGVGLADALITRLSRIRRFIVRPTSSVLRFSKGPTDPIQAGRDLNVQYILDGNIKRAGDRVRVTIQLLDVSENAAIWATSIDDRLTDVLALEDTVANHVLEAMLPQLESGDLENYTRRGTDVPEAFDHYLKGRFHFNKFTEEGLATAFIHFHHAIAADPRYALAYTGIADYYNWLGIFGVLPPKDCFDPAIEAARKAIQLDPELSNAHSSLGFSIHAGRYDQTEAEKQLRRALELDPANSNAYVWLGIVLFTQSRFEEGFRFARQATEFDPLSPFAHHNIGWALYYARKYKEAAEQYRKVVSTFPGYGLGHYGLAKVLRSLGETDEALAESRKASELMDRGIFARLGEAESYAVTKNNSAAKEILVEIGELSRRRYVSPYMKALVYARLGQNEQVLDLLEESLGLNDAWLNWAASEPAFDPIHDEPRFRKIIEAVRHMSPGESSMNQPNPGLGERDRTGIYDQTTLISDQTPTAETLPTPSRFRKGRIGVYAGAAVLLFATILAATHFIVRPLVSDTPTSTQAFSNPNPTLIVLPFRSSEGSDFDRGSALADALTNRLGNIKALRVLSSNTARFASASGSIDLRSDLRADFVVRGNLITENDSTSIRAELADTETGRIIRSETFASDDGDLFGLQSRIAEMVWTGLNIEPLPLEKQQVQRSYTSDARAYELYLMGKYLISRRSPVDLRQAISTFGTALNNDGEFAQAYVGMAEAYALIQLYDTDPPADSYKLAREYAQRALAFDEDLAEAHAINAYILFYADRERTEAELGFRRAVQLNPSLAQAHHWFALFLAATGKRTEALQEIESARRLDPSSASVLSASGMVKFYGDDLEGAIADCDAALAIFPDFVPALKVKRWSLAAMGDTEKAGEVFDREIEAFKGDPEHPSWQMIAAQAGRLGTTLENGLANLDAAVADTEISQNPYAYAFEAALAYLALGQTEKAFAQLFRAEAASSHGFNFLNVDPRLDHIRSDQRFSLLSERLGRRKAE